MRVWFTNSVSTTNWQAFAATRAAVMTTPQIINLIGRMEKNKSVARAERTLGQLRAVHCKTTT